MMHHPIEVFLNQAREVVITVPEEYVGDECERPVIRMHRDQVDTVIKWLKASRDEAAE